MSTPAAFLTPPLIHVCMQCVCRYGHWWPGCDGAEEERFNTLTGRLAVSMRAFLASSGWGKISVEVRVWDATYSTGCCSLLPAMAGNYSESIQHPKLILGSSKAVATLPSINILQSFADSWAGDTIIYYDCRGGTALGLGAA